MHYDVHGKSLPIPSFFQVYNYGGGNGDKDREIVYSELTDGVPALINYFYINNSFPHLFSSKLFDNLQQFSTIGDVYNNVRDQLIRKGEIYSAYKSKNFDFNKKIFLLDSGAFNILKIIAKQSNYNVEMFKILFIDQMKKYYEFANSLKVDIVVAFDLGGKYTHKDSEKSDIKLNSFLNSIDSDELNNCLLEETVKYLSNKKKFFPFVLATVHGQTVDDYEKSVLHVLDLEKKYSYKFWGFALGGIASYKQLDQSWFKNLDFSNISKRQCISAVGPAIASKITRKLICDNRPIHALGCGGYPNIVTNYFSGATSFDAASPVRRVGDGNLDSTFDVFSKNPRKNAKFSKFFEGGFNVDGSLREASCEYKDLYRVSDSLRLCGCPACSVAGNVYNIKRLYSLKKSDSEANYFSRQLIGLHAVFQHKKLCEMVSKCDSLAIFCKKYPNSLFLNLLKLFQQL